MPDPEAVPVVAAALFGARLDRATQFAELLVTAGVERGLIGPRESERIWSRHLVNCAAPAALFPTGARVVDVGSGAGLPGIVLALVREDLRIDLVEPLARRVQFLTEAVAALGLGDQVSVRRGRAEEPAIRQAVGSSAWVTARAVAPLDRLVEWCLPLLAPGGRLVAMKGSQAAIELAEHRAALTRLGVSHVEVVECGSGLVDPPVTVVIVERGPSPQRSRGKQ